MARRSSDDDVDRFGTGVENDVDFAALELAHDVRDFLVERELAFAVLRALAQHERFYDAAQCLGRQLGVGNHQKIGLRVVHGARSVSGALGWRQCIVATRYYNPAGMARPTQGEALFALSQLDIGSEFRNRNSPAAPGQPPGTATGWQWVRNGCPPTARSSTWATPIDSATMYP